MFHMLAVGLERKGKGAVPPFWVWWPIQLSLLTTATLGTEESGRCREVLTRVNVRHVLQKNGCCREMAVVERFKQESMYGMSAKKMAVVGRRPL